MKITPFCLVKNVILGTGKLVKKCAGFLSGKESAEILEAGRKMTKAPAADVFVSQAEANMKRADILERRIVAKKCKKAMASFQEGTPEHYQLQRDLLLIKLRGFDKNGPKNENGSFFKGDVKEALEKRVDYINERMRKANRGSLVLFYPSYNNVEKAVGYSGYGRLT